MFTLPDLARTARSGSPRRLDHSSSRRQVAPPTLKVYTIVALLLALVSGGLGGGAGSLTLVVHADSSTPDNSLYAWGYNAFGQLGNSTTSGNTPNPMPGLVNLPAGVSTAALAGGGFHSLAIGSNGQLYAWGNNLDGQLGNGTTTNSPNPVIVSFPAGVTPTAIAAGSYHSLAIGSDGNLYAWGYNNYGQLGNGTTVTSTVPVTVSLPAGVTPTAIAAGQYHSLAIGSDGNLYAWGNNDYGQLGNGSFGGNPHPIPAIVSLPGGATPAVIATRGVHNLVIGSDGKLYAWGYNFYGQLGNGTTSSSATPMTISLPGGVIPAAIATGYFHTLAIGNDGNLYAWGYNFYGQLGNGTSTNSSTPVTVSLPAGVTPAAISAGNNHNLAIGSDNKIYTWGYNGYGQLGNGTSTTNPNPTPLAVGSVAGIAHPLLMTGNYHSLAQLASPGQIAATGGSSQSATIGTAFAAPLVATVRDIGNNPVGSVTVTFTAPTSGAGGSFAGGSPVYTGTTDASGQVTATTFTANTLAGSYTVTATVSGVITPASFSLTNTPGPASALVLVSGDNQQTVVSTAFSSPLVAKVTDSLGNAVSGAEVDFTAPASGAGSLFAGGSAVYTSTTNASGILTTTPLTANSLAGSYIVTATLILPGSAAHSPLRTGLAGPKAPTGQYHLINLPGCNPLLVTSSLDDGGCGTLRQALTFASANPTKTVSIQLTAGSIISLTSGLTLSSGVAITTTAPCGVGAGNTMLPPIILQGVGANSGNGLTLAGNNRLYGLWIRGFSGVQIKAPPGSSTRMQCVRASRL